MPNYIPYHVHTDYSLLDSCTQPKEYIDIAVANGIKAMAFTEHGRLSNWCEKWSMCKEAGIKYIHGVEIYLTESLDEKVRDNYHTILLAKNMSGLKEINTLVSRSFEDSHFYYTNRLSFEEFTHISDNVITTSACLASPLNKLSQENPWYEPLIKRYDFLEIQAHYHQDQKDYNKRLLELSKKYNKPLIAGTDTHSSTEYKSACRAVLLKAKHKSYGDEDDFDLTFKTYDELVNMFKEQGVIPEHEYIKAIENTNLLYDLTEDIDLDLSIKYPILYGSREADEKVFIETINTKFNKKIADGIIKPEQIDGFKKSIEDELNVLKQLEMVGFMLSMSELVSWCKDNGIPIGPARGSVGGSRIAFITDVIDINPEQWHTNFYRFCNPSRLEVGDVDVDLPEQDRPKVFDYVFKRFGYDKTARVASFGTLADKSVIDEIGRAFFLEFEKKFPDLNNPWSLDKISNIKKEYAADPGKTRLSYKDLFFYFDGLVGTKVSQSVHPAGVVISPWTLPDNFGVFNKDGEMCLCLDMENIHDFTGLVKYDFLALKTIKVLNDACYMAGINYPKTSDINFLDDDVWDSMSTDLSMIFQFESPFAADCFKKFKPRCIEDMSLVTACIRPSGSSYRDDLLARKIHKNPSSLIDNLLKDNLGYLIYQCDTLNFLMEVCGLDGGTSDNVRRAIGRKQRDRLEQALPDILDGYCRKSEKPRNIAELEAKEFIQVIEDSASYQFGYNHSIAYCIVGYMCGFLRHYYPLQFITSYLNNAANDDDICTGTSYAKRRGIKITAPKWGISKGEYYYNEEKNTIAKGLNSLKYFSEKVSVDLWRLSNDFRCEHFIMLLKKFKEDTSINSRQLDMLVKIDFFSDFGNQRELLYIIDVFNNIFKQGDVKKVNKDKISGNIIESVIKKYSVGVTKTGGVSASYTMLDVDSAMIEAEEIIKEQGMPELSLYEKVCNYAEAMGEGSIYVSGNEEDRRKLYVTEIKPLKRKSDGNQFGYSVFTTSIGSGVESRFTVKNRMYNDMPIEKGDIIFCERWHRDKSYFVMDYYTRVNKHAVI